MKSIALGMAAAVACQWTVPASSFAPTLARPVNPAKSSALAAIRNRGLEISEEAAAPMPGGMILYVKAGPDGSSLGDCPFAHFVRIVLHEKGLDYEIRPSTEDTKPQWLIDYYDGSMPALRHRKECYVDSNVIAEYLDFFFQEPRMADKKRLSAEAAEATDGLFPAIAKYLKHTPDGDEKDDELKSSLIEALRRLEGHLAAGDRSGPFFVGNGEIFTLIDASLAPKLHHMQVGVNEFKGGAVDIDDDFPKLRAYMDLVFARKSFVDALYPEETVTWGWSNARKST